MSWTGSEFHWVSLLQPSNNILIRTFLNKSKYPPLLPPSPPPPPPPPPRWQWMGKDWNQMLEPGSWLWCRVTKPPLRQGLMAFSYLPERTSASEMEGPHVWRSPEGEDEMNSINVPTEGGKWKGKERERPEVEQKHFHCTMSARFPWENPRETGFSL